MNLGEIVAIGETSREQAEDRDPTEREWVDRARAGDRAAFAELVRRHRAKALGLAGSLTRDPFLAEDIVQEALIRAFLHLGTLTDAGRFMPWLHRIVRNQAYMKLRRGGPYGKERPFASLGGEGERSAAGSDAGSASSGSTRDRAVDWSDIDNILYHLADAASEEARRRHDPAECLMRKEMFEGIRLLVGCLTKRERGIFEARFFRELPPEEIAALFGTTTANVYNSLSRSRAKLHKERIRISIGLYVSRRAELGLLRRNILPPPKI